MTMIELFKSREEFKEKIENAVRLELEQFGVQVTNANIREMEDDEQTKYFENQSQRAVNEAEAGARIATAEALQK